MNAIKTGRPWPEDPAESIVTGKFKVRRRRVTDLGPTGIETKLGRGWIVTDQYGNDVSRWYQDFDRAISTATKLADNRQRQLMDEVNRARAERRGLLEPMPAIDHASYMHTLITLEKATA